MWVHRAVPRAHRCFSAEATRLRPAQLGWKYRRRLCTAAGADGDSRILGPAAAERPARLNKSMGSPGLLILLTRLCRKPRPYGLAAKVKASYHPWVFYFFVCVWKKHPHRQPTGYGNSVVSPFFFQSPEKPSFLLKWLVSCGQCGDTE